MRGGSLVKHGSRGGGHFQYQLGVLCPHYRYRLHRGCRDIQLFEHEHGSRTQLSAFARHGPRYWCSRATQKDISEP